MRVDLVEKAMRGDRDAFTALAAASVDRCYSLAYRILRDPHRAQDATQQALFGAWRDLPRLRDPERFEAWLHRLVVHACYGELRSHRRWTAQCAPSHRSTRPASEIPSNQLPNVTRSRRPSER